LASSETWSPKNFSINTDLLGVNGFTAEDWVRPKLMSRPIFGSTDRNELSSLMEREDPLMRRIEPPLTLLLQPITVRISRRVLLVLGGGLAVRARLIDLGRVTGVRLVERDRQAADVVGARLLDRCFIPTGGWFTLFRRLVLHDRSRTVVLVRLDDRPRPFVGRGCNTGTASGERKDWRAGIVALAMISVFLVRDLPRRLDTSLVSLLKDSPGLRLVELVVCSEEEDIFLSVDVVGPFIEFSACLNEERSDGFRSTLLLDLVRREEDSA
jgi:hypothetical protein